MYARLVFLPGGIQLSSFATLMCMSHIASPHSRHSAAYLLRPAKPAKLGLQQFLTWGKMPMTLTQVVSASVRTREKWAKTQDLQIPVDASNYTLKKKKKRKNSDFLVCNLF